MGTGGQKILQNFFKTLERQNMQDQTICKMKQYLNYIMMIMNQSLIKFGELWGELEQKKNVSRDNG